MWGGGRTRENYDLHFPCHTKNFKESGMVVIEKKSIENVQS
jgi:hypothetical protein